MSDEDAVYEQIGHVANALVIVAGTIIMELDRAGVLDRDKVTQSLRRKVFDAEETGAEASRSDLRYIRLIADAVDNEPRQRSDG